jgi:hypothetical protein
MATFAPDHRVTIRRAATQYQLEDISGDVITIDIDKGYGMSAGGFAISTTFKRSIEGQRYDQVLVPGDVVHIELDRGDGKGLRSRMVGQVVRCARKTIVNPDQSVSRRITITGMDFGRLLDRHNCVADITPGPGQIGPEAIVRLAKGLIFSGTPHEICSSIFDKLMIGQVPWIKPYVAFINPGIRAKAPLDEWETFDFTILESTGSVWAAMKRAANEPYNVLTTETINGVLHIILERYPFHPKNGKLTRETFHEIADEEIQSEDLGVDDNDRVNYVWLKADMVTLYNQGQNFPLQFSSAMHFDQASISRFGFHPFYPQTNFVPPSYLPGDDAPPNIQKLVSGRSEEFWNRNRWNHLHETGTLAVAGNPDIKAGDGIVVKGTGMEYFVEKYTEHYAWGETYTTTLQLTRGQEHGPT